MPNRILREGILTSERVDSLSSWASECFYRRLISVVDDFGRYFANPSLLRAAAYPLKLDKVSNADIDKWLADCAGAGLVSTYEVEGKRYLQVHDFRQQQRAEKSKYPPMPDSCISDATQMHSRRLAPDKPPLTKTETETETKAGGKATRKRVPMPANFSVSARVHEWARLKGFDRLEEHLEAFKRKVAAHGYQYVDWDASFMEAVREDWAKLRTGIKAVPESALRADL